MNSVMISIYIACYFAGLVTAFYWSYPIRWGTWLLTNAIAVKRENLRLREQNKKLKRDNEHLYRLFGRDKVV